MKVSHSAKSAFLAGMRATIPLVIGATPFGLIFGALAVANGLTPLGAMGMSLFVFAGSAQFIAVGMLAQGATTAIIVLTTFVVNLRHALYGASLAPMMRHLSQMWLAPLAFWLTDETYAVVISQWSDPDVPTESKHWFHFGSSILMYVNWQLWTFVGIVAGSQFENAAEWGLDFAMVVTFIGIVVPLIINRPMLVCALTAGGAGLLTYNMPNRLGILVASVIAIAAGYAAEMWITRRVMKSDTAEIGA